MLSLEIRLKQRAHELGFELVGIAPAAVADGFERLGVWLEQGCAGEMAYMHRHAAARRHPSSILPEVRSVVMVGMNYLASGGPAEKCSRPTCAQQPPRRSRTIVATPFPPAPRTPRLPQPPRCAHRADHHTVLRQALRP